jgi:hypothetical protein
MQIYDPLKAGEDPEPEIEEYQEWALDYPLMWVNGHPWTLGNACEGTMITGGTGSGKTSSSGTHLALSMLRIGAGGLVLTVKPDECRDWQNMARIAGREDDIIVFTNDEESGFNFLNYEASRPGRGGGQVENLVALLMTLTESNGKGEKDFFEKAMKRLLRNMLELLMHAKQTITMINLDKLLTSVPKKAGHLRDKEFQKASFYYGLVDQANAQAADDFAKEDIAIIHNYFADELLNLAGDTKSGITENWKAVADLFLRGSARKLFSDKTTVVPEMAFDGKIIIVDLPTKEYGEFGKLSQKIWKYLFQKAAERREKKTEKSMRPLFLYCDEAQNFLTQSDPDFQATARSAKIATIYITQNYSSYLIAMGGQSAKPFVSNLLGNLRTKIFHQNDDHDTNEWAMKTLSKVYREKTSEGFSDSAGSGSKSLNKQQVLEFDITERQFLELQSPMSSSKYSQFLFFQAGRSFGSEIYQISWAGCPLWQ